MTVRSTFANLHTVYPLVTCLDFSDTLHGVLPSLFVLERIQNEFQDRIFGRNIAEVFTNT